MLVWNKWSAIKLFFYKISPLFLVVDLIKYPRICYFNSDLLYIKQTEKQSYILFVTEKKRSWLDLNFAKRKQSLFSRGKIMSLIQVALPSISNDIVSGLVNL